MNLNLHLFSLITVFCTIKSFFVYENYGGADSRRHLNYIPKKTYILRMGPDFEDLDIKPITVKPESSKNIRKRHHKSNKKLTLANEKSAWTETVVDWGDSKKLSPDETDLADSKKAAAKVKILKKAKALEAKLNRGKGLKFPRSDEAPGVSMYHIDPVLNILRSRSIRRQLQDSDASTSGSSDELEHWKTEWQRHWLLKKYEAVNASRPRGDQVNIIAARPWGISCGDPKQHDMPWGSCMLALECEAEYRIYRGDVFCGRTEFVCCAIQLTNYDMFLGVDPSFEEQSMSTDSEEKKKGEGQRAKKRREKEKKKRQVARERRKQKIKRTILKTIKEIKKILNRAYSNGTRERQRKTKMLKKFVDHLKKQYKKDRMSIKELHAEQMLKIDTALMHRLEQVKAVNENFMQNATFANIIINGTISERGARMLVEAYPDLSSYFKFRRYMWNDDGDSRDYLDDDVEDGFIMYND